MTGVVAASPFVLFAHPNPDLYGSDLQLLESVQAVHDAGNRCVVVLPESGPLVPKLTEAGAEVEIFNFPVLRRSYLKSWRILLLLSAMATSLLRQVALIKKLKPDLIYVNTVTIPTWGVSARIARTRAITHVHEDENAISRILGLALTAPLLASDQVIANSESTRRHARVDTAQARVQDHGGLQRSTRSGPVAGPSAGQPQRSQAHRGRAADATEGN